MPFEFLPTDLYVTNGWVFLMPGLISPHFETLEGVAKTSGSVQIVDAGTNRRFTFAGQIMDFGQMTLTRTKQGTPDDKALEDMAEAMINFGLAVNAQAVKMHHGIEVFRILFEGFRISSKKYPNFDVNAEEKFLCTYEATCNNWTEVP